jgi:CRP-like cAMP-binding protein
MGACSRTALVPGFFAIDFNRILAGLSPHERSELDRYGNERSLELGRVLHRPDEAVEYLYFPTTALISLQLQVSGMLREVNFIGSEGIVGCDYDATTRNATAFSVVLVEGNAYRVPLDYFLRMAEESRELRRLLTENLQRIGERAQQLAACNLSHRLETRLCRWILQVVRHAAGDSTIQVTQDQLADLLGVNRARLNEAFRTLAHSGAVTLRRRGVFEVANVELVEALACDCTRLKTAPDSEKTIALA